MFKKLREWRREKAQQEGIPVFIIANNSELMEVIKKTPKTIEALRQIRGFGKKKIERYGKEIVNLIQLFYNS